VGVKIESIANIPGDTKQQSHQAKTKMAPQGHFLTKVLI
jgi:hypothetical protein